MLPHLPSCFERLPNCDVFVIRSSRTACVKKSKVVQHEETTLLIPSDPSDPELANDGGRAKNMPYAS